MSINDCKSIMRQSVVCIKLLIYNLVVILVTMFLYDYISRISHIMYILITCPGCTQARTDSWIYFGIEPGLLSNRCLRHINI